MTTKKRVYNSENREAQAAETKNRILLTSKECFQSLGFEGVTIEALAKAAKVSAPTIYSLFQSKRGVLLALMDNSFMVDQFDALIDKIRKENSPTVRFALTAKLARKINDAEKAHMEIFQGATMLAPEFKKLEKEKEQLRYKRQEETISQMVKENSLSKELSVPKARAILWAFTGRDMYRMFVVEQQWTSDEYEKWLSEVLIKTLM
ncbi:MAG: TetR/AcrR family transcriptional regulator [Parachlamydiaceae bacterium]|nr:TetR/AcrR family transcriptional regulator [Parachlamydiaceae bacterium]